MNEEFPIVIIYRPDGGIDIRDYCLVCNTEIPAGPDFCSKECEVKHDIRKVCYFCPNCNNYSISNLVVQNLCNEHIYHVKKLLERMLVSNVESKLNGAPTVKGETFSSVIYKKVITEINQRGL
jgi:hypothetical protein